MIALLCVLLGAFAAPPLPANAESAVAAPLYREGRGSPDGIGKFYQGREIADVMGFEGATWLPFATRPRLRGRRATADGGAAQRVVAKT